MAHNTKKARKEKVKTVNKLLKKLLVKIRKRMNWQNVQQPTALNFSIQNVFNNMILKNYSSISMLIQCILDAHYITVMLVE
jgi:hypothetical protein